ncbi:MAG: hypothetical protein OEZ68_04850 [Gammaproteobacteria bacterium]|nr:hypothetical protein [Gammaproteobacteria bacterium]MDH5800116.1 hypothetical protein [Gammaproteobacteria bacterium]
MKMVAWVLLMLFTSVSYAEPNFYLSPQIGVGRVHVKAGKTLYGESYTSGGFAASPRMGVRLSNDFVFEVASQVNAVISFGDSYDVSQTQILFGKSLKVSNRSRLINKIGLSKWELRGYESPFLNPGPEDRSRLTGVAPVYVLEWERNVNRFFAFGINSSFLLADFGSAMSGCFLLKLKIP